MKFRVTTDASDVRIIADGLVANVFVGEGRPIPAIIIDASKHPNIPEYIAAHEFEPPGDVDSQWSTNAFDKNELRLELKAKNL
jgi:hypothetical protein